MLLAIDIDTYTEKPGIIVEKKVHSSHNMHFIFVLSFYEFCELDSFFYFTFFSFFLLNRLITEDFDKYQSFCVDKFCSNDSDDNNKQKYDSANKCQNNLDGRIYKVFISFHLTIHHHEVDSKDLNFFHFLFMLYKNIKVLHDNNDFLNITNGSWHSLITVDFQHRFADFVFFDVFL